MVSTRIIPSLFISLSNNKNIGWVEAEIAEILFWGINLPQIIVRQLRIALSSCLYSGPSIVIRSFYEG
jgi:hypothetical protein